MLDVYCVCSATDVLQWSSGEAEIDLREVISLVTRRFSKFCFSSFQNDFAWKML